VPLGQPLGQTFYNRHGDVFGWACLLVAVAGLFWSKRRLHTGGGIG
jgi:apolipoprotein N-acyltransferase